MDVDWIIIHVATFSRATRICIRIISSVLSAMIFRIRSCRAINNVSNDILERAEKKVSNILWPQYYSIFFILGILYFSSCGEIGGVLHPTDSSWENFPTNLMFHDTNRFWKWRWIARSFIWWMIGAQFSRKKNLFFGIKLTVLGQGNKNLFFGIKSTVLGQGSLYSEVLPPLISRRVRL